MLVCIYDIRHYPTLSTRIFVLDLTVAICHDRANKSAAISKDDRSHEDVRLLPFVAINGCRDGGRG